MDLFVYKFDSHVRNFLFKFFQATDKGERPLIGFCQFTVQILDVNDNAPQFTRSTYETSISRGSPIGSSVLSVLAEDGDSTMNAQITYSLLPDETSTFEHRSDVEFFQIENPTSGEITLIRKIPVEKERLVFMVLVGVKIFKNWLKIIF